MSVLDELKPLSAAWVAAKAAEDAAKQRRIAVEQQIVAHTGVREKGSQTFKPDGFKVSVEGVLSVKMDWNAWDEVSASIPTNLAPVKTTREVDVTGVLYLRANEPEIYAKLPITVAPGKPRVSVTPVTEG